MKRKVTDRQRASCVNQVGVQNDLIGRKQTHAFFLWMTQRWVFRSTVSTVSHECLHHDCSS